MKLKQMVAELIDSMNPDQILTVYEVATQLNRAAGPGVARPATSSPPFLELRELLKGCAGNLSDDIAELRANER